MPFGRMRCSVPNVQVLNRDGCACGKIVNEDDGSPVTWRCSVCGGLVCRTCTLTIDGSVPLEYHLQTFCSKACWEKAGSPPD